MRAVLAFPPILVLIVVANIVGYAGLLAYAVIRAGAQALAFGW